LHRAAIACGVLRYIQQSSGFFLNAVGALANESSPLALNASPGIAKYAQMYAYVEQRALESSIEGIALRYGHVAGQCVAAQICEVCGCPASTLHDKEPGAAECG
jgi:hypothetical protein